MSIARPFRGGDATDLFDRVEAKMAPLRPRCIYPDCDKDSLGAPTGICMGHAMAVWKVMEDCWDDMIASRQNPDSPRQQVIRQRHEAKQRVDSVYIVKLGDRVKIGFTTNMHQRMRDVPHEEILAVVPGTMQDEARCHAAFAHLRVAGEWFRAEPELLQFAREVDTRGKLDGA
jgi:T5orf172 domain.